MIDTTTLKALLKQETFLHKSDQDFAQAFPYLYTDLVAPNDYEVSELDKFPADIQVFQSIVELMVAEHWTYSGPYIANTIAMNVRDLSADAFSDLVRLTERIQERHVKALKYEVLKQNLEGKVSHELNEETP